MVFLSFSCRAFSWRVRELGNIFSNAYNALEQGIGLTENSLGFWLNVLVTEVDLAHLTQGSMPSPYASLLHFILIGFTIVITLLLGQVYCGYICPFGALQEFISRIGRHFYLRSEPEQHLERRMRYLKYLLLAGMLAGYWLTRDMFWVSFNPMQHFFAFNFSGWLLPITVISLLGALFYYRFWCRYFCPFGAFLAFGNKIALLRKWAPQRDYTRCDLGVDDDYDIDCIRCHRCVHVCRDIQGTDVLVLAEKGLDDGRMGVA